MIKINPAFKRAFTAMNETGSHVFLTGNAGTGKSTLLRYFREKTTKKSVVLAPTGVAALNVKGQTIHSFFGFKPSVSPQSVKRLPEDRRAIFKMLDTIIIDEISMVRADLLDCVDKALRLNRNKPKQPFGGVQMVFIGDLYQLPPILTDRERFMFEQLYRSPFFFSAYVLKEIDLEIIELKKIYRQKEKAFIHLLDRVRNNRLQEDDLLAWNERHDPWFEPESSKEYVHLTTTNKMADARNEAELNNLNGKEWKLHASFEGNFEGDRTPAPATLRLKQGARVMFVNNDMQKRWVNGTMGTVEGVEKDGEQDVVCVELEDGKTVRVLPNTWELFAYAPDGIGGIGMEITGTYRQFPLTLAWAVTIHKAQGKTFDRVFVDIGWGAFAHGQMYVALSRCTTFKGIVLKKPFQAKDVILDERVAEFAAIKKTG